MLKENFDDAVVMYVQLNLGMEIEEAENKAYEELRSDYGRELIAQSEDLVKYGTVSKKDQEHRQVLATAKHLQINDDMGFPVKPV